MILEFLFVSLNIVGPLPLFFFLLATFPLDLTKTRLQMQGEAALARLGDSAGESAPYRGMVRTALGIVQEEGFLKLWQGVTPAIYRHVGIYLDSGR